MGIPTSARITLRSTEAPRRAARNKADSVAKAGPIVKWAGGKTRLLPEIQRRVPSSYRRYFEPFVGGAAVFFHLRPSAAVLSDDNADLINTYRCVASNVEAVIRRLRGHKRRHDEAYYYRMRERWNERLERDVDVDRAALFIYLNKTCYNGLWRVNSKGGFNVPVGRYDDPTICDVDDLRAAASVLKGARLEHRDFTDAIEDAGAGDFVYFDPPYHPLTETSNFTSYTSGDFGAEKQEQLASEAYRLVRRGAHVLLSNSDTPFVRKLYRGWKIDRVKCSRAINSRATSRGDVSEVLISS